MIQAESTETYLKPTEKTVLKGYQQCRDFVRENFDEFKWAFSNLSGHQKYGVWAILTFSGRCWQLLNLDQGSKEAAEIQNEWRDENRDWFNGKYRSAKLVALLDTFHKFRLDRKYLVNMLEGVEYWLSRREFKTLDELQEFARLIGGPVIQAIGQIVEYDHGDVESNERRAEQIGQAIAVSQMLSRTASNVKRGRVFFPTELLTEYDCRVSDLCLGRGGPGFDRMVQVIADQARSDLLEGAHLLGDLSFDGQRVMKSILSLTLRVLDVIRESPESVLERRVQFSLMEQFRFQLKHILGMEGTKELEKFVHH